MKIKFISTLFLITVLASLVRIYQLDQNPAGVYLDEASIGYNAYSILKTGLDEYGKSWPIFFRSFSTFQAPLYTYISIIPIYFFDLNIFSTRILSAVSGILSVIFTFLIVYFGGKKSLKISVISALTLTFSPWAIFVSRVAVEANLALTFVLIGFFFLILSLKKNHYLLLGATFLSLSTYCYHGERIFSNVFLLIFLLIFRNSFLKKMRLILLSLIIFFALQIPQIFIATSPGSLTRLNTQGYLTESAFNKSGVEFKTIPFGRELFIAREFSSQYLTFFSPRNLFFDPESQLFRSIPNLSTFCNWMIVPLIFGFLKIWKSRKENLSKFIILVTLTGPIPGALARDPFYALRVLPLFWALTIIISFGIEDILDRIKNNFLKFILISFFIFISLTSLVTSFILLKYERSESYGYPFIEISKITEQQKNTHFMLVSENYDAPYIWLAFYKKLDPRLMQHQIPKNILDNYYNDLSFNRYRTIDNITVKKLQFGIDPCVEGIIITDNVALSLTQAKDHELTPVYEFKDLAGNVILTGYKTHPKDACQ